MSENETTRMLEQKIDELVDLFGQNPAETKLIDQRLMRQVLIYVPLETVEEYLKWKMELDARDQGI